MVSRQDSQLSASEESDALPIAASGGRRRVPSYNDMLIIRPTVTGYAAFRDPVRGSWLIECICKVAYNHEILFHAVLNNFTMNQKVFVENAHEKDLQEMCNLVAKEMQDYQTERGYTQSAVLEQRGSFNKLYFNPKLHEGNNEVG